MKYLFNYFFRERIIEIQGGILLNLNHLTWRRGSQFQGGRQSTRRAQPSQGRTSAHRSTWLCGDEAYLHQSNHCLCLRHQIFFAPSLPLLPLPPGNHRKQSWCFFLRLILPCPQSSACQPRPCSSSVHPGCFYPTLVDSIYKEKPLPSLPTTKTNSINHWMSTIDQSTESFQLVCLRSIICHERRRSESAQSHPQIIPATLGHQVCNAIKCVHVQCTQVHSGE